MKIGAGSTMIPCLRYRDAAAAIDWLCGAFRLERQLVVPDEGGGIAHAQLTWGAGMIMIGSQPVPEGWAGPGDDAPSVHVLTPDPDLVHDRARAAGAAIVQPIADQDFGGRAFTCRDPGGYVWSFGSYDPWHVD